ncbi:hypothetical protein STEG23_007706 [Scotinomys teguina]
MLCDPEHVTHIRTEFGCERSNVKELYKELCSDLQFDDFLASIPPGCVSCMQQKDGSCFGIHSVSLCLFIDVQWFH